MFDLLCRFERQELDCISDMLHWLIIEGIPYHDEEEAAREDMPR